MVAEYRGQYWYQGLPVQMVTVRKTKNNKTAHLFTDFVGVTLNGNRTAFCNKQGWTDTGLSSKYGNWQLAPELKLCNNCMRAWQREHSYWLGEP